MNWEAIAAVSEVAGAVGVIISLVYLAVQIRHNTQEVRAASFNAVTDSFNQWNLLIAQDAYVAGLFQRGAGDLGRLEASEEVRFALLMLALFRIHESIYFQSNRGTMERDLRDAENRSVKTLLEMPGVRAWWKVNPYSFTREFRAYIDTLIQSIEAGIG